MSPPADDDSRSDGILRPPPKRAGLRSQARVALGDSQSSEPHQPPNMVCQRCGAEFRWERTEKPGSRSAEWAARLIKGSEKCDCGYGLRSSRKKGPHP